MPKLPVRRPRPVASARSPVILISIILILVVVVLGVAIIFIGDFGEGYKVEVTGQVVDTGILDFQVELENIQIGAPMKDPKILSFSPMVSYPWSASFKVEIELPTHDGDLFQFAHPYTCDVGELNLLSGGSEPFTITVRHLDAGTYIGTIAVTQSTMFGFGEKKVIYSEPITIIV